MEITMLRPFKVPTRENVNDRNKAILDNLENKLGMIPNIYATYAYSDNALERYMNFANGATTLDNKEKEIVNLVVSQINGCSYCLAAHTQLSKMNGFSDEQILEIREGHAGFNNRYDALAQVTSALVRNRGTIEEELLQLWFDAGFTKENLVDLVLAIADKTATNLLHNVTDIPVDFPEAPKLQTKTH